MPYFGDIKKTEMVSAQPIGLIFKGLAVQKDCMTLDDGTDTLSRNIGKKPQFHAAWNSKNSADPIMLSYSKIFIYFSIL